MNHQENWEEQAYQKRIKPIIEKRHAQLEAFEDIGRTIISMLRIMEERDSEDTQHSDSEEKSNIALSHSIESLQADVEILKSHFNQVRKKDRNTIRRSF